MGNSKNAVKVVTSILIVIAAAFLLLGRGSSSLGSSIYTTTLNGANAVQQQSTTTNISGKTPPPAALGPSAPESTPNTVQQNSTVPNTTGEAPAPSGVGTGAFGSSGPNNQATGLTIAMLDSYYSKPCDLGNVTQITVTSESHPGYSTSYNLSDSEVVQSIVTILGNSPMVYNYSGSTQNAINETRLINLLVCAGSQVYVPTPQSLFQLARQDNGTANGGWFTSTLNGSTTYLSISSSQAGGNGMLTLEERQPNATYNDTFISRTVILNGTRTLSSVSVLYIPGENPMTSVPLASLVGNYSSYTPPQFLNLTANVVLHGQPSPITNFSYQFS